MRLWLICDTAALAQGEAGRLFGGWERGFLLGAFCFF
jgi:hypothetical protein